MENYPLVYRKVIGRNITDPELLSRVAQAACDDPFAAIYLLGFVQCGLNYALEFPN